MKFRKCLVRLVPQQRPSLQLRASRMTWQETAPETAPESQDPGMITCMMLIMISHTQKYPKYDIICHINIYIYHMSRALGIASVRSSLNSGQRPIGHRRHGRPHLWSRRWRWDDWLLAYLKGLGKSWEKIIRVWQLHPEYFKSAWKYKRARLHGQSKSRCTVRGVAVGRSCCSHLFFAIALFLLGSRALFGPSRCSRHFKSDLALLGVGLALQLLQ